MHSLFNHAWFQAYRSPTTQTKRGPHSALPATEGYGWRGAVSRRAQQKSLPLAVFGTLPLARPSTEFLSALPSLHRDRTPYNPHPSHPVPTDFTLALTQLLFFMAALTARTSRRGGEAWTSPSHPNPSPLL